MTSDWLGGGLIVGLAAVLWLIYLVPTWFRRNEFIATERNVVRLQQTLRILAETAEAPDEVRAEANARSVVEQQRLLKKVTVNNTPPTLLAATKIRRARAVTSAILVLALAVVVLGAVQIVVNGAWVLLALGVVAATLCVTRLGRLAKDGRALRLPAPGSSGAVLLPSAAGRGRAGDSAGSSWSDAASDVEIEPGDFSADAGGGDAVDDAAEGGALPFDSRDSDEGSGWTPVPLPKPLYVGHRRLVAAEGLSIYAEQTAQQAEDALRAAARMSESVLRAAAIDESENARDRVQSRGVTVESPFSAMGIITETDTGTFDVDQVLARRRAG